VPFLFHWEHYHGHIYQSASLSGECSWTLVFWDHFHPGMTKRYALKATSLKLVMGTLGPRHGSHVRLIDDEG